MAGEKEKLGQGRVRHGMEWQGKDSFRVGGGSVNRYGQVRRGMAGHVLVWHGRVRFGKAW